MWPMWVNVFGCKLVGSLKRNVKEKRWKEREREEGGYLSGGRIMGNGKPSKTVVSGHVTDQGEIKKKEKKKSLHPTNQLWPEAVSQLTCTLLAHQWWLIHLFISVYVHVCSNRLCECDDRGSVGVCSAEDGRCYCKTNVEGQSCNRWPSIPHPCMPSLLSLFLICNIWHSFHHWHVHNKSQRH